MRRFLPVLGVLASFILFVFASTRYPGGYDWSNQSISSLFQPAALNHEPNGARSVAAVAVVVFAISMAVVFNTISKRGPTPQHSKIIRIAGINAMVYTALVITPMHDVLVGIALLFFVTTMVTIFHRLFVERRFAMLGFGVVCIGMTLTNATMYYGNLLYGFLPIVQKLAHAAWVVWLGGLYLGDSQAVAGADQGRQALGTAGQHG